MTLRPVEIAVGCESMRVKQQEQQQQKAKSIRDK
jgi:hypothetical protein